MRYLLISAMLLGLSAMVTSAAQPQTVVTLGDLIHHKTNVPHHVGQDTVTRDAVLQTGVINYGVRYCACWDSSHPGGASYLEGYIGMPRPSAANWYHSGFLHLDLNGQDLGLTRLSDMWVSEQGPRGSVKMYWDAPVARVTMSFVAPAGDDRLFVGISLQPKTDIKSIHVRLSAYPSYFTYAYKRKGNRKLMTATKTYDQGARGPLDVARQCWLAFYDTIFDPDKGEGDGGCAMAFVPDQVEKADFSLGSYASTVDLNYKPETRLLRLVFWDFNHQGNKEALAHLTQVMPATLKELRTFDFAPLSLTDYDVAAARQQAAAELAKVAGSDKLLAQVTAAAADISKLQEQVRSGAGEGSPATVEKQLRDKLAQFQQLQWDVKFFALING